MTLSTLLKLASALLLTLNWLCFFGPAMAHADLKQLVMPGPLVEAHAQYEQQCERCHEPFKKRKQADLCLACHKFIATDLNRKTGFHGLSPLVIGSECSHCHTDHEGRQADILMFDPETFDHELTNFKFSGAHKKLACTSCHPPSETDDKPAMMNDLAPQGFYSRAPHNCVDCHAKTSPHKERLGDKCNDCHNEDSWKKVTFDHNKTKFKLNAMHAQVSCVLCHPNQNWKNIAVDCYSCHLLNDAHSGRYGQKCQTCHSDKGPPLPGQAPQSAWMQVSFDHDRTKFKLEGQHRKRACDLCHPQQLYGQQLKTDCFACHQKTDRHAGLYGTRCESCHTSKGWKTSVFDHQKTTFPLRDKHQNLACRNCHTRPTSAEKLGTSCINCHRLDDVHRNPQNERCERCHTPKGWRNETRFDHDLSPFPLLGLHSLVPCESCHQNPQFRATPSTCISCHRADDKHKQRLGSNCEACHTPNGWRLWQFDHNRNPEAFKLEGAHVGLDCLACHQKPIAPGTKISLPRTCAECHAKEDIHRNAFGRNCERCHLNESFKKLRKIIREDN
jgi:hypothetical protein